jgi:hypothetical protein
MTNQAIACDPHRFARFCYTFPLYVEHDDDPADPNDGNVPVALSMIVHSVKDR